jgi:hypothetical protein
MKNTRTKILYFFTFFVILSVNIALLWHVVCLLNLMMPIRILIIVTWIDWLGYAGIRKGANLPSGKGGASR